MDFGTVMSKTGFSDRAVADPGSALSAWFDIQTDRIVRGYTMSLKEFVRYNAYFDSCRDRGQHMTTREFYARRLALRSIEDAEMSRPRLHLVAICLVIAYVLGFAMGRGL
jgi:hypothetical protein